MGESQSRFSIINRMTSKTLQFMTEKANLDDECKKKEQKLEYAKKRLAQALEDFEFQKKEEHRRYQREIDDAQFELDNHKATIDFKKKLYDEKIEVLQGGLSKIQKITELSSTSQ